jgi:sortase A
VQGTAASFSGGDEDNVPRSASQFLTGSTAKTVRSAFAIVAALAFGFALNVVVGSRVEHSAAQTEEFNALRPELNAGVAPIGSRLGRLGNGTPVPLGTPMALIEIPSIGVKEVVDEGTTGAVLMNGPGHLPSSVFPGGVGTSEILGRSAAYGGPFARIAQLHKGATITVTTQGGTFEFAVIDVRRAGAVIPALGAGQARLTLATAIESSFIPTGVVWVDADLIHGTPFAATQPVVKTVPPDEQPLGMDIGSLWGVAAWLAVLAVVLAGAKWTWRHRGHAQAWIIFFGPIAVIGYLLADQVGALLPNLM